MPLIDGLHIKTPFYGWPEKTAELRRRGYPINLAP
jgi:hypothetical protein